MRKEEFLKRLRKRLSGLPDKDTDERISFYSEIIDDRIEDGLTEEEAVAAIGTVDSVVEQIINETPIKTLVNQRIKPKRKLITSFLFSYLHTIRFTIHFHQRAQSRFVSFPDLRQ